MPDKERDELVVSIVVQKGTQREMSAAIKYLQSISARAEADIVNVSSNAQRKIISAIERLRANDLASYSTNELRKSIASILGKMSSDIEILSRRMIAANVLAGKIKSIFGTRASKEVIVSSVLLSEEDHQRIERMVADAVDRMHHGAELTMASVMSMIQRASIRSNMPHPKSEKDEGSDPVKQEPLSVDFSGESIDDKRPSMVYRSRGLTREEIASIQTNPFAYVDSVCASNLRAVKSMQAAFQKESARNQQVITHRESPSSKADYARQEILRIGAELRKQGVSAFTDKGGKRWSLLSYCSMTARTTSTESSNTGEVFGDAAHDLYYIVPHGGSCPLCAKYEGKVYSRSGKDTRFPPLSSVFKKIDPSGVDDLSNTYMSIHPNCRHKIIKYYEDRVPKKVK